MNKGIKIFLWCAGSLAAVLLLVALSGYLWSFRLQQTETLSGDMNIASDAKVGLPVSVSQTVILPIREEIKSVEVFPGKGSVAAGFPHIGWKRYLWSRKELTISQQLVPVAPGNIGGGSVKVIFRSNAIKPIEWAIPPFDAAPLAVMPGAELHVADAMKVKTALEYRYLWTIAGLIALGVALYFYLRIRKHRMAAPEPPWTRALKKLERLRFELRQRRLQPEQGFVRLTDVVRDYIEERFCLPASRKTTAEFMEYLADNNPLPEDQRPFLSDFLSTADQVKFAKAPPDALLLSQAIDRAEKLISTTGDPGEEKEAGNV